MKKYKYISLIIIAFFLLYIYDKSIFIHILYSLYRMSIGFLLSIILGILIGALLSTNKYLLMAFKPLILFLMSIPTITWVPILLIFFGINDITIIISIFIGSFFTILYNTIDGIENVNINYIKLGKILGYSTFKRIFFIYIPASFNQILVGLKLGISYSWRALIGAEMLGASENGLGVLLFSSKSFYNIYKMLIILLIIGFLGFILNKLIVDYIEENTLKKWGLINDRI